MAKTASGMDIKPLGGGVLSVDFGQIADMRTITDDGDGHLCVPLADLLADFVDGKTVFFEDGKLTTEKTVRSDRASCYILPEGTFEERILLYEDPVTNIFGSSSETGNRRSLSSCDMLKSLGAYGYLVLSGYVNKILITNKYTWPDDNNLFLVKEEEDFYYVFDDSTGVSYYPYLEFTFDIRP